MLFALQDRKNHENGLRHKEAKEKKIAELRGATEEDKLDEKIKALERAAAKAVASTSAGTSLAFSEYSTYKPSVSSDNVQENESKSSTRPIPSKHTQPTSSTPAIDSAVVDDIKSQSAPMPGKWEVVEEDAPDNPYRSKQDDDDFSGQFPSNKPNPKKRERYEDDEDAMDMLEMESRTLSSTATGERVPEQYRSGPMVAPLQEGTSFFKPKAAKASNVKKRVKQL